MATVVERSISRADLVRLVDQASEGCANSSRAKWRAVAETTDAVAVGWFHCDGAHCPARQAGRRNQSFQEAFDRAMATQFGCEWDDDAVHPVQPFVVRVDEAPDA
jgi:hypothetical protein